MNRWRKIDTKIPIKAKGDPWIIKLDDCPDARMGGGVTFIGLVVWPVDLLECDILRRYALKERFELVGGRFFDVVRFAFGDVRYGVDYCLLQ